MGCRAAGDIGSVDLAQCGRFPGKAPAGMEQPEEPSGLLYSRGSGRTWLYDLEECDIGVFRIKKIMENEQKKEKTYWLLAFLLAILCGVTVWFGLYPPPSDFSIGDNPSHYLVGVLLHTFGMVMLIACLMAFFGVLYLLLSTFRKFWVFPKAQMGIWIYVIALLIFFFWNAASVIQTKKEIKNREEISSETNIGLSSVNNLITPGMSEDQVKGIFGIPSEKKQYGDVESHIYNFVIWFRNNKFVSLGYIKQDWRIEGKEDEPIKLNEILKDMSLDEVNKLLGEPVGKDYSADEMMYQYHIRVIFLNGKVENCIAWNDLKYRVKEKRSKLK